MTNITSGQLDIEIDTGMVVLEIGKCEHGEYVVILNGIYLHPSHCKEIEVIQGYKWTVSKKQIVRALQVEWASNIEGYQPRHEGPKSPPGGDTSVVD